MIWQQHYSRSELAARDLSMYLTPACGCNTRYEIVAVINANGTRQYRLRCILCQRLCGVALLHAKLDQQIIEHARLVCSNVDSNRQCERCGTWTNGVELHHWAPVGVFSDFDEWPKSWLCPLCHLRWHQTMHGYRWNGFDRNGR